MQLVQFLTTIGIYWHPVSGRNVAATSEQTRPDLAIHETAAPNKTDDRHHWRRIGSVSNRDMLWIQDITIIGVFMLDVWRKKFTEVSENRGFGI